MPIATTGSAGGTRGLTAGNYTSTADVAKQPLFAPPCPYTINIPCKEVVSIFKVRGKFYLEGLRVCRCLGVFEVGKGWRMGVGVRGGGGGLKLLTEWLKGVIRPRGISVRGLLRCRP